MKSVVIVPTLKRNQQVALRLLGHMERQERGTIKHGRQLAYRPAQRTLSLLCRAALFLAILTCLPVLPRAEAEEYLLGPQDKVRIKIYEWRASRDAFFEWAALNDEFTVAAEGMLSLPFAGEVKAAGLTVGEVGAAIGDQLMRNMGLGRRPDASVEVVSFRPFYILGDVVQPGEFPYRPGLTVLQALSIAGGIRTLEEDQSRFGREIIQSHGEIGIMRLQKINLLARMARLEAELAGATSIEVPKALMELGDDAHAASAMHQEKLIFDARHEAIETQVRALETLRTFLGKELESLEAQLVFLDKQVALIQEELTGVSSLVSRGLAAAPREMSLERALAQIQGERLSAETGLLRTRQEISRTEISLLDLSNRHATDVTETLRQTQAELDGLERKAETAFDLLHESRVSAPRHVLNRASAAERATYAIVRQTDTGTATLSSDEATPLMPGDTLKVEIPLPVDLEEDEAAEPEGAAPPVGRQSSSSDS